MMLTGPRVAICIKEKFSSMPTSVESTFLKRRASVRSPAMLTLIAMAILRLMSTRWTGVSATAGLATVETNVRFHLHVMPLFIVLVMAQQMTWTPQTPMVACANAKKNMEDDGAVLIAQFHHHAHPTLIAMVMQLLT